MRPLFAALFVLALVGCTYESHTETSVQNADGSKTTTRTETVNHNGKKVQRKTETTVRGGQTTKVVYEKQGDDWVKTE